jgi:hypothetical protein
MRPQGPRFDLGAVEHELPSIEDWTLEGAAFNLRAGALGDLVWQVEFSEDLIRWTPVGTIMSGEAFEGGTERRAGFYRLRLPAPR